MWLGLPSIIFLSGLWGVVHHSFFLIGFPCYQQCYLQWGDRPGGGGHSPRGTLPEEGAGALFRGPTVFGGSSLLWGPQGSLPWSVGGLQGSLPG